MCDAGHTVQDGVLGNCSPSLWVGHSGAKSTDPSAQVTEQALLQLISRQALELQDVSCSKRANTGENLNGISTRPGLNAFQATRVRSNGREKRRWKATQLGMMTMSVQTKIKSGKCLAAAHAENNDGIADGETHNPDSEPEDDTIPKTSRCNRKAATTPTATPPSTRCQTMNLKTNWSHGSTTECEQHTRQTTCWLQIESRRVPSDRAGKIGNKQQ